jgi:hypothetical protein
LEKAALQLLVIPASSAAPPAADAAPAADADAATAGLACCQ